MPDTTVLLLGAGGREHAIAWKLAQSKRLKNLYAMPGSDAIAQWAQNVPGDPCDAAAVVKAAKDCHAKLVVIGPEAPLAAGVADALREAGFKVFGPSKAAARLEASKAFSKQFMKKHKVPTARFEVHTDPMIARGAAEAWRLPVVIKADGLAAGKGVFVCKQTNEALGAVTELLERGGMGDAGRTIVIEDGLEGPELSVLMFCDGKDYRLLAPSRDHKRLKDGDQGPNTGGMGVFAPVPVDPGLMETIDKTVIAPVMAGLAAEKLDYRGLLYIGLMLTKKGPMTLEFNCRFGDPETQAVLPLLDEDLVELMLACADGKLGRGALKPKAGAAVCVTLAAGEYPARGSKGLPIQGLESVEDAFVFHAGTAKADGKWVTNGGRVLSVTGVGKDLPEARAKAYAAVAKLDFAGMQYRKDIALEKVAA
jgi:phosphoribosylamine--glycine ligase